MCGRFTLIEVGELLFDEFFLESGPDDLIPRYNIAPTQPICVITDRNPSRLAMVRWGLVPPWSKDLAQGGRAINARVETAATLPTFRDAFANRRALVLADGFYEWTGRGSQRRPVLFRAPDRRPFAFAGLWERWRDPTGKVVFSGTILTAPANEVVARVHDRMPIVIPREARGAWLNGELTNVGHLIEHAKAAKLEPTAVSTFVNSPFNEGPACVEPVTES